MDETLEQIARHTFAGHWATVRHHLDDLTDRELLMIEHNVANLQYEIKQAQARRND